MRCAFSHSIGSNSNLNTRFYDDAGAFLILFLTVLWKGVESSLISLYFAFKEPGICVFLKVILSITFPGFLEEILFGHWLFFHSVSDESVKLII